MGCAEGLFSKTESLFGSRWLQSYFLSIPFCLLAVVLLSGETGAPAQLPAWYSQHLILCSCFASTTLSWRGQKSLQVVPEITGMRMDLVPCRALFIDLRISNSKNCKCHRFPWAGRGKRWKTLPGYGWAGRQSPVLYKKRSNGSTVLVLNGLGPLEKGTAAPTVSKTLLVLNNHQQISDENSGKNDIKNIAESIIVPAHKSVLQTCLEWCAPLWSIRFKMI